MHVKYYHGYQLPEVDFTTTTRGIVEKVSRLAETPYPVAPLRLGELSLYRIRIVRSRAIAVIQQIKPYLTRLAKDADEMLEKIRERSYVRIV